MADDARAGVAVAVLTHDRPADVATLLSSLARQTAHIDTVVLVDSGTTPYDVTPHAADLEITYLRSESNLGGAGGFSLAILAALATTADWVWIMDDDARPEADTCLRTMLAAAAERGLDAVSPIVVAPEDGSRLSFPFRVDGRLSYDRAAVTGTAFWPGTALLFNGLLISRDALFEVGLPDLRLFIRGDEVDYLLRLKKSGVTFGTLTAAAFVHPTGWAEVSSIIKDRYHILVPETEFKRFYFFRNRGYLIRRHVRPLSLLVDLVGYSIHYVVKQRDVTGYRHWLADFRRGLRADFSHPGASGERTRSDDRA